MNFLQRWALKAAGIPFEASALTKDSYPYFGQGFELWNQFWGPNNTKIDFTKELGDLRHSTLIMAGHQWIARNTAAARLQVVELDKDNKEQEIQGHPFTELMYRPNAFYGFKELISGISYSWLTAATAYILRVSNAVDQTIELWYEPHWSIRPVWPTNGSAWISGYEVHRNGRWYPLRLQDVIVLRNGIDPETRCGQSATQALIGELYTEQQAARFTGLLLRHGLVPPIVVSVGDKENPASEADTATVAASLKRKMSGDTGGEPLVINKVANVEKLGFDYSSVGLREVRQVPEERFCAALGISPYSLHFGTSRSASTFSNVKEYLAYDYKSYIVPFQEYIADVLGRELLPAFDQDQSHKLCWNYDAVELMQSDMTAEWKRVTDAYKSRVIDLAEARDALGYKWTPEEHKDVWYPVLGSTVTYSPIPSEEYLAGLEEPAPKPNGKVPADYGTIPS